MKTIGRYTVRGLLGRGGMSKVYKVAHPVINKISALKLLCPDPLLVQLMGQDAIHRLFEKEAVTMATVQHPNIVSILDYDAHAGRPFYVMDFFANSLGVLIGETSRVEEASRIIPTGKALDYARQTIEGIGCLHDAGIVHRDIKPYNLLITGHDTVKIGDLGLSRLRGERHSGPPNLNIGSPFYASPEQETRPNQADARADLYAAGVTLYRMLTGRLPATGTNGPLPASQLNPDLDRHWDRFLATALAADPAHRFQDAKAMLAALARLQDHWESVVERICRLSPADQDLHGAATSKQPLRQRPVKADPGQAAAHFATDALWRPRVYVDNAFEATGDGTVIDHATGLVWQQAGSDYSRTWEAANQHVADLRAVGFGGRAQWRLPTVNELMTLLRPPPKADDLCIAPIFDPAQRWIWSADRRSFISAYYVDFDLGFVGWQDFSAPFYVRAVSNLTP